MIELGGRNVKVLHTPGHSPGHLCFYDEANKFLFTGDLIYGGLLYANYPSTDPIAYLASVNKLSQYKPERIFPGHHSQEISPKLIGQIKNELQKLADNNLLCHGSGRFDFDGWSILL